MEDPFRAANFYECCGHADVLNMILVIFFGAMGDQCSDKPSGFGELFGGVETTIQ